MDEQWVTVEFPLIKENTYEISSKGNVRFKGNDFCEKLYISTNGWVYYNFKLSIGSIRMLPIDTIVLSHFKAPHHLTFKNGTYVEVCHIDGDRSNSNIENLMWVKQNIIWRPIVFRNVRIGMYEISSNGDIRNVLTGIILQKNYDLRGYEQIELAQNYGDGKGVKVHQIMASTFLTKPSDEFNEVNHIDGLKYNNTLRNLEWVTPSMNQQHAYLTELQIPKSSEDSIFAILNNKQVEEICKLLIEYDGDVHKVQSKCSTYVQLYNINAIKYGSNWRKISEKYFEIGQFDKRTSDEVIHEICKLLVKYDGDIRKVQQDIQTKFGVYLEYKMIQSIRLGYTYNHISQQYFDKEIFINKPPRYEHPKGESCSISKITDDDVRFICENLLINWGLCEWTYRDCKALGMNNVTLRMINHIKHKECWNHISDEYFNHEEISILRKERIVLICKTLIDTNFNEQLTFERCKPKMKYLTIRAVHDIKLGYIHKDISKDYFEYHSGRK